MYFLAWCFWVISFCTVIKLRRDQKKGGYTIPDFMSRGYDQVVLEAFKNVPRNVVDKHYRIDRYYILLYTAASLLTSFAMGDVPAVFSWIPGAMGAMTAVLDSFENHMLKGYYRGSHSPWMPKVAPMVTRAKSFFAWGWFISVPVWLIWQAVIS